MKKLVYGVGVNDCHEMITRGNACYTTWKDMLRRCYNPEFHEQYPTYIGCVVCPDWHRLSVFKEWYDKHYVYGWQLDKDLIDPDNKIYSPDTCLFVPRQINTFVIDSGAKRGEYPLGVSWNEQRGKFQSNCSINGKRKNLGRFTCPNEAHNAWRKCKLEQVHAMKPELDAIDTRLFPALCDRYK